MPIRMKIRAVDHPDRPTDPMCAQKGDIVRVHPANWEFGSKIVLPNWIRVRVNGTTYQASKYLHSRWARRPELAVVAQDTVIDRLRLRLHSVEASAGELGGITLAETQPFVDAWDCTVFSSDINSVTFDLNVRDASFSVGFWGDAIDDVTFTNGVVFNEISYDQEAGKHVCTADYSASIFDGNQFADRAIRRGADVLDNIDGVLTYEVDRQDIRAELRRDMHEVFAHYIGKHRYSVSASAVDQVIAAGGTSTFGIVQLTLQLQDRAASA